MTNIFIGAILSLHERILSHNQIKLIKRRTKMYVITNFLGEAIYGAPWIIFIGSSILSAISIPVYFLLWLFITLAFLLILFLMLWKNQKNREEEIKSRIKNMQLKLDELMS